MMSKGDFILWYLSERGEGGNAISMKNFDKKEHIRIGFSSRNIQKSEITWGFSVKHQ